MRTSRRRFTRILGATAVAAPLLPLVAEAQQAPPPSAATDAPPLPERSAATPDLARAWTEMVRAQYGDQLTLDELARIEDDFRDTAGWVTRFREATVTLSNSDEPDFTFSAEVRR